MLRKGFRVREPVDLNGLNPNSLNAYDMEVLDSGEVQLTYHRFDRRMSLAESTEGKLVDALAAVVWYNGLDEDIRNCQEYLRGRSITTGCYWKPADWKDPQLEVIWMLLVRLYGDYGTSPRHGWVTRTLEAINFLEHLLYYCGEDDSEV